MIKLSNRVTQVRFLRFLVAGSTVMAVQVGSFWLFEKWWSVSLAFFFAYVLALVVHYSLNRFWALPSSRTDALRQGGEYLLAAVGSFALNYLLFHLGLKAFGWPPVVATLIAAATASVIIFLVLNFRVFRA